ncbi:hypothetical protein HCN44_000699 [Aphidius gifuensis]|uniref:Uncharacterized protein n=1 Tax=Aphidius gifuensis TaxID=684658 RepID=A0A834XTC8_APHGI|nr:hypothetical protein HCN44_000699 [Aphidius gifuensis]
MINDQKFIWDDFYKSVVPLGTDKQDKIKSQKTNKTILKKSKLYCPHGYLILNISDTLNPEEKIRFRKCYQRKIKIPDIIILKDIKNLVLFLIKTPINKEFVKFFHLNIVDRFLRCLIMYFQLYIDIWNEHFNNKLKIKKLQNPFAGGKRITHCNELKILRCILAKEYCDIITGCDESINFHHMKTSYGKIILSVQSQGEKDLRLYEILLSISHRIVWIALKRQNFNLIEIEIHPKRKYGDVIYQNIQNDDIEILHGKQIDNKNKLLKNSTLPKLIINDADDYRILSLGIIDAEFKDPRIVYLKNCLLAKEESLQSMNINIGILGHPRSNYDIMLCPIGLSSHSNKDDDDEDDKDDNWQTRKSSTNENIKKASIIEDKFTNMPEYSSDTEIIDKFPVKIINNNS